MTRLGLDRRMRHECGHTNVQNPPPAHTAPRRPCTIVHNLLKTTLTRVLLIIGACCCSTQITTGVFGEYHGRATSNRQCGHLYCHQGQGTSDRYPGICTSRYMSVIPSVYQRWTGCSSMACHQPCRQTAAAEALCDTAYQ